jgi:hypothetical protein
MRLLSQAAVSGALIAGWCQVALADPLPFEWSPSNVGLTATGNVNATALTMLHYADITINTHTGRFTENGVLAISGFLNGSVAAPPNGLNTTYNLYFTFQDTGYQTQSPPPNSGASATGAFTTLNYTVWASPTSGITVGLVPGGTPTITGQGSAFPLFYGSLIGGALTLTAPVSGGYSPSANADVTVTPCTANGQTTTTGATCTGNEASFFVSSIADQFLTFNLSAGADVTTLTPPGPGGTGSQYAWLDINAGTGGNASFQTPEPGTLMLLASGVLGLGVVGSRRKRA